MFRNLTGKSINQGDRSILNFLKSITTQRTTKTAVVIKEDRLTSIKSTSRRTPFEKIGRELAILALVSFKLLGHLP